ncbi:hypothetical protein, partial [Chromobacterium violaceum]|uniref:hypothetical protein n=1 Tax=Chromobacterium violaceum TaxID=536 RepID=UPI0005D3018F
AGVFAFRRRIPRRVNPAPTGPRRGLAFSGFMIPLSKKASLLAGLGIQHPQRIMWAWSEEEAR